MLTTIQALARRSAPGEAGFIARFEDRVQSLAINQDILVGREWREVPINELLRLQLTFIPDAPGEFRINGPLLSLAPRAAEVIGMAIHELATNSLKYGALSAEHGYVDIGWSHREDGTGLKLWWREHDGPPVEEPRHNGFGTTLIRDVPRHNLGAEVSLTYKPDGVCWELACDESVLARQAPVSA
jgi:two-component sensor histidine kinase